MDKRAELLRDLILLVERYGADTIRDLARLLGTPDLAAELAVVLRAATEHAPQTIRRGGRKRRGTATGPEGPTSFSPEASSLERRLRERRALPRLGDVVAFAQRHRIDIGTPKKRERAVASLLREFRKMDSAHLGDIDKELAATPQIADDTLSDWSRIILPAQDKAERNHRK